MLLEIRHIIRRRHLRRPPTGAQVTVLCTGSKLRAVMPAIMYAIMYARRSVIGADCSSECPVSIKTRSPRLTPHAQHHKTRNRSQLGEKPTTCALWWSNLVPEPIQLISCIAANGGSANFRKRDSLIQKSLAGFGLYLANTA